jgi:hypothetical protein
VTPFDSAVLGDAPTAPAAPGQIKGVRTHWDAAKVGTRKRCQEPFSETAP